MLKVLELFGGIGACTAALKRLGINYEIVDYVEIDKYAVASYNAINGTNFETQDITTWDKDIKADLIMHGSPCQDFSLAGKQAGGDEGSGTRSSLMYETIRIVEKIKPKYVIWENVKNVISKKHKHNFDNYINRLEELGYNSYYQVLNAKDYGIPQNRERVFTISIRKDIDEGFDFPNKEILNNSLQELLENNVEEKYFVSEKGKEYILKRVGGFVQLIDKDTVIAHCPITAQGNANWTGNFVKFEFPPKEPLQLRLKDMLEQTVDEKYYLNDAQVERIKATTYVSGGEKARIQNEEMCSTLCARDYKDPKCVQVGNLIGGKWDKMQDISKRVYSEEGISPSIHTCQGGNTEPKVEQSLQVADYRYDEGLRVRKNGLSPAITTQTGRESLSGNTLLIKNATKQGYLEAEERRWNRYIK